MTRYTFPTNRSYRPSSTLTSLMYRLLTQRAGRQRCSDQLWECDCDGTRIVGVAHKDPTYTPDYSLLLRKFFSFRHIATFCSKTPLFKLKGVSVSLFLTVPFSPQYPLHCGPSGHFDPKCLNYYLVPVTPPTVAFSFQICLPDRWQAWEWVPSASLSMRVIISLDVTEQGSSNISRRASPSGKPSRCPAYQGHEAVFTPPSVLMCSTHQQNTVNGSVHQTLLTHLHPSLSLVYTKALSTLLAEHSAVTANVFGPCAFERAVIGRAKSVGYLRVVSSSPIHAPRWIEGVVHPNVNGVRCASEMKPSCGLSSVALSLASSQLSSRQPSSQLPTIPPAPLCKFRAIVVEVTFSHCANQLMFC
ncbi:hypothetical protein J6590_016344 [Homalodisca vitripennis]|nr:hypothetical protein J6590_016344 [Homalodisca vitripennis]